MNCKDEFISFLKKYNIPHEVIKWRYEYLPEIYTSVYVRVRDPYDRPQRNEWLFSGDKLEQVITSNQYRHVKNKLNTGKVVTLSTEKHF